MTDPRSTDMAELIEKMAARVGKPWRQAEMDLLFDEFLPAVYERTQRLFDERDAARTQLAAQALVVDGWEQRYSFGVGELRAEVAALRAREAAFRQLAEEHSTEDADGDPHGCNTYEIWASELWAILDAPAVLGDETGTDKAAPDAQFEPGRWWRVTAPDGSLWCETSNEKEARDRVRPGDTLSRLYEYSVSQWREVWADAGSVGAQDQGSTE